MKAKLIKTPLLNSLFADKNIEFAWEFCSYDENCKNGKDLFLHYNKNEFSKTIDDFHPQLAPFQDLDLKLSSIIDRNEYLEVETGKLDEPFNLGGSMHIVNCNNGKSYEIEHIEYMRLVLFMVFPDPEGFLKSPYRILKLVSLPVKFVPGRKHSFTVFLPSEFYMIADSCREYYVYAFSYIFEFSLEHEDHGSEYMVENILSFSNTYSLTGEYRPKPVNLKPTKPKPAKLIPAKPKPSKSKPAKPKLK